MKPDSMPIDLSVLSTGRWQVTTASGTMYTVDLDDGSLRRRAHSDSAQSIPLRRDCNDLAILKVHRCRVGQPALFAISGANPDPTVVTFRETTIVTHIERSA